jgi:hypothetical protein
MKKSLILILLLVTPLFINAQNVFDKFEDDPNVSSVVVTSEMFKLLSKMDLSSDDPEAQEYLDLINNLKNIKVFSTESLDVAKNMNEVVSKYLANSKDLVELMRVKDKGQNIKFYVKKGSDENHVSELLMYLTGSENGKTEAVIMSITGNIDLKKISKLTKDLNVPGSDNLKKLEDKKSN